MAFKPSTLNCIPPPSVGAGLPFDNDVTLSPSKLKQYTFSDWYGIPRGGTAHLDNRHSNKMT